MRSLSDASMSSPSHDSAMDSSLSSCPFSFQSVKDGNVRISHHGKVVKVLSGKAARQFLARIEAADELQRQHLMARVTGNYKRGNERPGKPANS